MNGLYDILRKNQTKIDKSNIEECILVKKYSYLFDMFDSIATLKNSVDDFDIIRSSIVIYSILNKTTIEEFTLNTKKTFKEINSENIPVLRQKIRKLMDSKYLRNFTLNGKEIFIPIFPKSLNVIYAKEQDKLFARPYNNLIKKFNTTVIDLFETYNFNLYDSQFTRLVCLKRTNDLIACYHHDFKTLYFIDTQGRLQNKLALFDKYIFKPNLTNVINRLSLIIDAYLDNDYNALIEILHNEQFISGYMLNKIKKHRAKLLKRKGIV